MPPYSYSYGPFLGAQPAPSLGSPSAQEMAARVAADSDSRRWKQLHNHYSLDFAAQKWYQIDAQTGRPMGPMSLGDNMKENIATNAHLYLQTTKDQAQTFSVEDLISDARTLQHPDFCAKYRSFPQMVAGQMFSAGIAPNQAVAWQQQQQQLLQMRQRASTGEYPSTYGHFD